MRARSGHAALIALAAVPLAWMIWGAWQGRLGPEPVETITHTTGSWALKLLLASLAVTPLRRGWPELAWLAPYRRTLGLLAFVYATLHFATFLVFDLGLDFSALGHEIRKRPYVTLGFSAFCALVPLAATSTRASQRRLGRRWVSLHRAVYAAGVLAVAHFLWLVKADLREPLIYGAVLAGLLAARTPLLLRARTPRQRSV